MSTLLVLPKLNVQKANAHSSSISVGFPAMTGFFGFVHALERHINQTGRHVKMPRFGVAVYDVVNHRHREPADRFYSLKDVGKPLKADGGRQSTVEFATCDITITLAIEIETELDEVDLVTIVQQLLHSKMRLCGGDIIGFNKPWVCDISTDEKFRWFKRILMPAQIMTSRHSLLLEHSKQTQDSLESILSLLSVHYSATGEGDNIQWQGAKIEAGWLVPIGVGYYALSDVKAASNMLHTRDNVTPHCFVESLISIGEFKLSYRLNSIDELLWSATYDEKHNLYQLEQ
ncbi:type I-F CRISPR-associated protein Csy2 [Vibrio navarrensis]|nr:type I-F CRISPR-associated protein Csy2 [Vibrio navarrensis]